MVERTHANQRQVVEEDKNRIYCLVRDDGLAGVVIANKDYPPSTAHHLVSEILAQFKYPKATWSKTSTTLPADTLQATFDQYKDPSKVPGIANIQKELDDTKDVLTQTIQSVLERGESCPYHIRATVALTSEN